MICIISPELFLSAIIVRWIGLKAHLLVLLIKSSCKSNEIRPLQLAAIAHDKSNSYCKLSESRLSTRKKHKRLPEVSEKYILVEVADIRCYFSVARASQQPCQRLTLSNGDMFPI